APLSGARRVGLPMPLVRKLFRLDGSLAEPQIVSDRVSVLGEEFSRYSNRVAIVVLSDGVGAEELIVRTEIIAAILHFALPPAIEIAFLSRGKVKPMLWRNYDRVADSTLQNG